MATALHTFMDIFEKEIDNQSEPIQLKKIVIPIIQRDYAQGRKSAERVRDRFLDSLYSAVTEAPITLDFIYGDIDEAGIMTPLDGQQRLTTLFLLHWYAAKRDDVPHQEYAFLKNFSYETRYSARDFCTLLIDHTPSFVQKISEEIIDQPWFPLDWNKDQTVSSMLVMLDAIHKKFACVEHLWETLKGDAISFYFLPIKDMGLTDELYIKMNSRGKPLTLFEHFKAELERNLRSISNVDAERIMRKVDIDWTDLLWAYRGDDKVIDDEFLRYFHFICDTLCYRAGGSPQGKSGDEFVLLDEYFSTTNEHVLENIKVFESFFDCWCQLPEGTPTQLIEQLVSHKHEPGKIKIETRYQIDIFKDCLRNYADTVGGRNRRFPLNRFVLLYAIVDYLLNRDTISQQDFARRLRVINNLVQNSEFEISDSENRSSGNRMPAILRQVDSVIINGFFDDAIDPNFNTFQIEEEKSKLLWCSQHPDMAESLFEMEDHPLLYGQIGIIGTSNVALFQRFSALFSCNWDLVDCALLSCGFYVQAERNKWRHQMGSKSIDAAWKNLFHNSANSGYQNTKETLLALLNSLPEVNNQNLQIIAEDYIADCESRMEYDWRYYYIKYPSFRPGRYGKYSWLDYSKRPYEFLTMWTEFSWSSNARQPFLYEIDPQRINRDDSGQTLSFGEKYVKCLNSAFVVCDTATRTELARLEIAQNDAQIDIEDRIKKGKAQLSSFVDSVLVDTESLLSLAAELKAAEESRSSDKFVQLKNHLLSVSSDELTLSFADIESIIGSKLCESAYKYSAYWHISPTHTMPNTILEAGYRIVKVNIKEQLLTLHKAP